MWNKTESRRDPRTGRRRRFAKPESEWVVHEDASLRVVPEALWNEVRTRRDEVRKTWPGEKGKRGFSRKQGRRQKHFPTHLLSGTMVCAECGSTIAQVSGKSGGYYGCLGAAKGSCNNKMLVRRKLVENVIVGAVSDGLASPKTVRHVLNWVEHEVAKLYSNVPETIRLKEPELDAEERRLANFVEFIGEGRGSQALAKALRETERRVDAFKVELDGLRTNRDKVFQAPPAGWVEERLAGLKDVLERRTEQSALLLRDLLGPIRLEPTQGNIGRPYYLARTSINTLTILEPPPRKGGGPDDGSNSLRWSRRRESNPRPK